MRVGGGGPLGGGQGQCACLARARELLGAGAGAASASSSAALCALLRRGCPAPLRCLLPHALLYAPRESCLGRSKAKAAAGMGAGAGAELGADAVAGLLEKW